ncbi:hypothetical protein D7Y07_05820 [Bacteroides acidifaciens]|uniref:Uncharacterized protein n=1 Tax=Bacteroides acidifaciens TaxID=85831 RepID=A0A3L8AD06_9BACE|nr:hypothetical protein D7Y07_05820 [Bacteroides acidifaciens]
MNGDFLIIHRSSFFIFTTEDTEDTKVNFVHDYTGMNEILFSITDLHKYNMNFGFISSTSFTL